MLFGKREHLDVAFPGHRFDKHLSNIIIPIIGARLYLKLGKK